jgi:hypothetical protein
MGYLPPIHYDQSNVYVRLADKRRYDPLQFHPVKSVHVETRLRESTDEWRYKKDNRRVSKHLPQQAVTDNFGDITGKGILFDQYM